MISHVFFCNITDPIFGQKHCYLGRLKKNGKYAQLMSLPPVSHKSNLKKNVELKKQSTTFHITKDSESTTSEISILKRRQARVARARVFPSSIWNADAFVSACPLLTFRVSGVGCVCVYIYMYMLCAASPIRHFGTERCSRMKRVNEIVIVYSWKYIYKSRAVCARVCVWERTIGKKSRGDGWRHRWWHESIVNPSEFGWVSFSKIENSW